MKIYNQRIMIDREREREREIHRVLLFVYFYFRDITLLYEKYLDVDHAVFDDMDC